MQKSLLLPLFIIILSVQPIFALEFDIIDFKPDPLDFHGRSYSVKDMNADLCALLRVESDLTGELYITDVPIEKREKKKDAVGIWYFYMSFRERHVTFTSKGYSPLTWKIPERMERGKVYIVRIRTKGEKQPEGLGNLRIETEPPGCTIFLNEVKLADTTPVTLENQPAGVHRIRIEKDDDYLPVDTLLTIRDKETTNFKHRLILSYGILSITSQPSNANATLLDDNIDLGLTPINDIRINPGALKIRIEKDGYDPFEKIIELDYGERRSVEAKLIRQVGSLDVSTIPEGAKIYLDGKYYGTTPSEVKGVPTGAYEIKLDKAGYDLQLDRIEIKRNEVTEHTRTLSKAGMREWRKRRLKAMLMSSVVPGGGQFVSKQYIRGGLYASVFIGSIAMVYLARQDHTDAKSEYNDAMTAYHQLEDQAVLSRHLSQARSAWEDMNSAEDRLNMIMFTAGGLYALQIIDTWIWGGGKRPVAGKFSSKVKLQPYAALDLDYVKVGVNLCWI